MKKNNSKRAASADRYAAMIVAGATKKSPEQLAATLGRTGSGSHDSRPNRQRTRAAANRAAMRDYA